MAQIKLASANGTAANTNATYDSGNKSHFEAMMIVDSSGNVIDNFSSGYTGSASAVIGYTGSRGYDGSVSTPGYTGSVGVGYTGSASAVIGYTGSKGYTGSTPV